MRQLKTDPNPNNWCPYKGRHGHRDIHRCIHMPGNPWCWRIKQKRERGMLQTLPLRPQREPTLLPLAPASASSLQSSEEKDTCAAEPTYCSALLWQPQTPGGQDGASEAGGSQAEGQHGVLGRPGQPLPWRSRVGPAGLDPLAARKIGATYRILCGYSEMSVM